MLKRAKIKSIKSKKFLLKKTAAKPVNSFVKGKKRKAKVLKAIKRDLKQVNNQTEIIVEMSELSVNNFLVDEQLSYSKEKVTAEEKIDRHLLEDIDNLIFGKDRGRVFREVGLFKEVLPANHIKIVLNQGGETKREKTSEFFSSVHRVDLKKNEESLTIPQPTFKRPLLKFNDQSVGDKDFRITETTLNIPQTSLIKKEKIFNLPVKIILAFKHLFRFKPAGVKIVDLRYNWLAKLKMTLNFAVIALLLILPIRALFFYQSIEKTKGQVLGISEEALGELERGAQAASQADWQEAGVHFQSANNYFVQAKENLDIYNQTLINIAKNLPATGGLINSGEYLLQAGDHLTKAAGNLTTVLGQISKNQDLNQTITDNLFIVNLALAEAEQEINSAANYLLKVKPQTLPAKYQSYFSQVQKNLPGFIKGLKESRQFLDFSLAVLGHQIPKRYLFLFQNNNELRATGGFLGSAALVDLKKGRIVNLEVPKGGLYDLKGDFFEKVISPDPMHLLGTSWGVWDANWWPDFPTSAGKINWFLEKSGWPTVDGIITFNASLLPKLLEIVGNIELPEYNQLLTPANVVLALQHEVEFEYNKTANQPKKVIADLMPILINKLLSTPTNQALPLLLTLNQALTEKEIQFYFIDEELEQTVKQKKWAGEVLPTGGDYLLVVNQNIGGGKSDAVINQEIKHYAYLQLDGSIIDTVAITRNHHGNPQDVFEKIQNNSYIRVYVPQGSRLLEVTGYDLIDPSLFKEVYPGYRQDDDILSVSGQIIKDAKTNTDVYSEFNKTVFGNWLQLKPGESKTITFSYQLPFKLKFSQTSWFKKAEVQKYSLLIQNQSGSQSKFTGQLFTPPELKVNWSGSTFADQPLVSGGEIKFETILNNDNYYGVLIEGQEK